MCDDNFGPSGTLDAMVTFCLHLWAAAQELSFEKDSLAKSDALALKIKLPMFLLDTECPTDSYLSI